MRHAFYRLAAVIGAIIFTTSIALAQTKTVSGVVSDEAGKPLEAATVSVKGGAATTTDKQGVFKIDVPSKATSLLISYVGMETEVVSISGKSNVRVTLKTSDSKLGEVVLIGYGRTRRA